MKQLVSNLLVRLCVRFCLFVGWDPMAWFAGVSAGIAARSNVGRDNFLSLCDDSHEEAQAIVQAMR